MTGVRQLLLVVVVGLASFGALFAAARADNSSKKEPAQPAIRVQDVALPAASVSVADLGRAKPLPAMRERRVRKAPEPVVETPVVDTPEPAAPAPVYTPPSNPAPSNPAPAPPPSDPGESFDDSG